MIEKKDYLKSYKRMNSEEQLEYLANVEKWTEDTYPRLAALDDSWKEADVKDFDEGLKLATALQKAQGFISTHQRYDVCRRLEVLRKLLTEVRVKSGLSKAGPRPAGDKRKFTALVPGPAKVNEEGVEVPRKPFEMPQVCDRRPEHVSQYMHLLPEDLRTEAQGISVLYDQMAHWRSRAEYLALDPRADQQMAARAAKNTVKYEERILNFWHRVDLAYEKSTKGKTDEQLAGELAKEAAEMAKQEVKSPGEYTKDEIEAMEDGEQKESCRKARIEANKKYLRRDDTQISDERKAQMKLRADELVEWGIPISRKQAEILEKYGLEIPEVQAKEEQTEEQQPQVKEESAADAAVSAGKVKEEGEVTVEKVQEPTLFDNAKEKEENV